MVVMREEVRIGGGGAAETYTQTLTVPLQREIRLPQYYLDSPRFSTGVKQDLIDVLWGGWKGVGEARRRGGLAHSHAHTHTRALLTLFSMKTPLLIAHMRLNPSGRPPSP